MRTVSPGKPGDGPHLEGRAEDYEQAGLATECLGSCHRPLGELLAEHDDARLQDRVAGCAHGHEVLPQLGEDRAERRDGAAGEAVEAADRAVQLDDVGASGPVVERVDVLRRDRPHVPVPLELCEREVPGVRHGRGEHRHARAVPAPHTQGVLAESVDRGHLVGIDLLPEPAGRAKVGDAALGAHPGAAEDHGGTLLQDQRGERLSR